MLKLQISWNSMWFSDRPSGPKYIEVSSVQFVKNGTVFVWVRWGNCGDTKYPQIVYAQKSSKK